MFLSYFSVFPSMPILQGLKRQTHQCVQLQDIHFEVILDSDSWNRCCKMHWNGIRTCSYPHTPCHSLSEYLQIPQTLGLSQDTHTPCQGTFGLLRHYRHPRIVQGSRHAMPGYLWTPQTLQTSQHPRIVQGSTHTMPPFVRVSLNSSDTMDILGLSQDPHTHHVTLCQSICRLLRYCGDLGVVQGSIHTMPPSVRVSVDSLDTVEILRLSRDPYTPCHPLSEYLWTLQTLWTS